ncbi:vesicle transport v-snare protein vti1 [Pleurotus eryngii]|uniref:Vesicle transport v-snare protein vti1 n=1 Tax=Pleurotus eryngii TaxID=5323 RepID=A0A9P6DI69_PLEER|nr:vesicle transport v-snare protein vti1 [Pleurotus eryngii]
MNNSPTTLFDSYEQDFQQFIETIRPKLEGNAEEPAGGSSAIHDQRKASLRRVEMELDEADEMVSQMEIEIQGISQSIRAQYQSRLRTAKADLARYKKLFKDSQAQVARSDLFSSKAGGFSSSDDPYSDSSDRSRLLAGTSLLEDGSKRLQESHRIALETEDQGAEILMNLRTQREQIENSRNTLYTADSAIDRASGTLKKMIRRMYQQRLVTAAIITVLVLLIGVIVWEKFS